VGGARDATVIDGLARRVIANTAYAQVRSQLSRTVDLIVQARYADGSAPFDGDMGAYHSRGGSVRVSWAFARMLSTFGEFLDTDYSFSGSLQRLTGTSDQVRRSVRVGFTWLLPLKGSS
jgi:hypothetical protein